MDLSWGPLSLRKTKVQPGVKDGDHNMAHLRWAPSSLSSFEFSGILHVTH